MKSDIFKKAIASRRKIKFIYGISEIILEPYYISINNIGKKVIYGRVNNTNEIKMFEYDRIFNIKVLNYSKFSPLIPIMAVYN